MKLEMDYEHYLIKLIVKKQKYNCGKLKKNCYHYISSSFKLFYNQ